LEQLEIEDGDTLRLQPCKSPVWDTAIALNALTCFGQVSDDQKIADTVTWLMSKKVSCRGDWSVKRPNIEPGGWYFEYANEFYPDIDDTAMVLLALKNLEAHHPDLEEAQARAINWLMAMQGKDGGWASFDVDNNRRIFCQIPFADHNAMIDPSTSDITARVLEALAAYGFEQSHPAAKSAVSFLLREQETDGSWFGRWGVNYIYGTSQVLKGLSAIGLGQDHPSVARGVSWLLTHQNTDGGWGENICTYEDPSLRGQGENTASQTAWAVMGLMAAGRCEHEAVRSGIEYLIRTQTAEGTWDEEPWTGTGFPKVFYLKYHLYRHSFPLWALGIYWGCRGHKPDIPSGSNGT
jgi:squalene-hopene/tetraprenyl-beta-curcumene cyclase